MIEEQEIELKINPVDLFKPLFKTKKRYIDCFGGRGRGASHNTSLFLVGKLINPAYFRGYIMREIFNDIRLSIWKDFTDRLKELEIEEFFHINENEMYAVCLQTGNELHSLGFKKSQKTRTGKLKSLANATHVLIEEADEISLTDWDNLDDSIRTQKAENIQIIRNFNSPSKNHWIIKNWYDLEPSPYDGYFVAKPKSLPNFLSIFGTYQDNENYINKSQLEKIDRYRQASKDSYEFEHYLTDYKGLVSSGLKGLVYKNYSFYTVLPDVELYRIYGLDFGYSPHPSACLELNFDKRHRRVYIRLKFFKLELKTHQICELIEGFNPERHEVICDNAEKREIQSMQVFGVNAMESQKGPGSIVSGIDTVKGYELFFYKNDKITKEELENYIWMTDMNGEPLGKPIDAFNHCLDATRYGIVYYDKNFGYFYRPKD